MYYWLDERNRINELRREIDDLDSAKLMAHAVNDPGGLESRRKELITRLRNDPKAPSKPTWTHEEMQEVAQRLVTAALKGKPVS